MNMYIYIFMCVYIYIYIDIYLYTYIYIYHLEQHCLGAQVRQGGALCLLGPVGAIEIVGAIGSLPRSRLLISHFLPLFVPCCRRLGVRVATVLRQDTGVPRS